MKNYNFNNSSVMRKLKAFYRAWNIEQNKRNKIKERQLKVNGLKKILFSGDDTNESVLILKQFNKEAESKLAKIGLDSGIVTENINEYFKTK